MSNYFEIAYAAASGKLCFFTGTGFSKAISGNSAPTWQGLLEDLCDLTQNGIALKSSLFPAGQSPAVSLDEAAQIISIHLDMVGKSIHQEAARLVGGVLLSGDNSSVKDFLSGNSVKAITTNYDKLFESLAGEHDCQSISPGLPIPRHHSRVKVYHVHGSVDSPENMVITSDDYFRFLNAESYFSRKLSTILHENTVVILGYSLGDTNLKAILSDYKGFSRSHYIGSNIFLVSRQAVGQGIKDYYSHCYGIRVIDSTEVAQFFAFLNFEIPGAKAKFDDSLVSIRNVLFKNYKFTDNHLRIEGSFYEIVSSLGALGVSIGHPRVVATLGDVVERKVAFTRENGAWVQYEHLARWLVYLMGILDVSGTDIEGGVLRATLHSMQTMSRELLFGYSWKSFKVWRDGWAGITSGNRRLIRDYIESECTDPDALSIVRIP
ncbi:SIR2 family protein [Stenotrophomonas maltophilia]|nr:SIR2 family protein [Stenotrophomonas maltophilia]